jgi:hypothetical protein
MSSVTDWITEGPLRQRYHLQPTGSKRSAQLVVEQEQPDRNLICNTNVELAKADSKPRDLSFGRYLGSIPLVDYQRLKKTRPEIFSNDPEIARPALIKFWNSADAAPFRVQRA